MSNSGGSSPFLESPEDVNDVDANVNEIDLSVTGELDKDNEIRTLKYQLTTLQNEYEIETLRLQRKYDNVDRQYKTNIDTLEKTLKDLQDLYQSNGHLQDEIKRMRGEHDKEAEESNLAFSTMKSDLEVKNNECEFLRKQYELLATRLEAQENDNKIEIDASHSLIKRYESEITKQSNEIVRLRKSLSQKDEDIEKMRVNSIIDSHKNYSTEEIQELTTINKLLKDQTEYVKELEEANINQSNELKKLRLFQDTEVYWKSEYEKTLQTSSDLKQQVETLEMENIKLSSQLSALNVFMGTEHNSSEHSIDFEQVLRDYNLLQKEIEDQKNDMDKLQADLTQLRMLNDELALERNQSLDLHKNYEASILNLKKLNHELEQQKLLSFEECKLLRQELENINFGKGPTDDTNGNDTSKHFIRMISDVQSKNQDLTEDLKLLNDQLLSEQTGSKKRKTSDQVTLNYSKRLNELQIDNLKLTKDLQKANEVIKLLEDKVKRLVNIKEKKIRILQLRDNPLAKEQFIKKKQIDILKRENQDLLTLLNEKSNLVRDDKKYVPRSVFESLNFDIKAQEEEIFKLNKKSTRLTQVFNKKSLEFIDVVTSLLGFKLEFQRDGRIKIYSCFKPDKYVIADLTENSLKSTLNTEIEDWSELLHLWIEQRSQIPCFLAVVTLKLWEKSEHNI